MSRSHDTQLRARLVFDDCRAYLSDLKKIRDPNEFRRRWFGFIALLRGVGHVLDGIDGAQSRRHRAAIEKHHDSNADIFRHFIKSVRDQTIKEYRSGLFSFEDMNSPMGIHTSGEVLSDSTAMAQRSTALLTTGPMPYKLREGPFKDYEVWDVIDLAIEYWDHYLSRVERELQSD